VCNIQSLFSCQSPRHRNLPHTAFPVEHRCSLYTLPGEFPSGKKSGGRKTLPEDPGAENEENTHQSNLIAEIPQAFSRTEAFLQRQQDRAGSGRRTAPISTMHFSTDEVS
jgi:hypothetical protein